ncbi:hypothetical protein [Brevibacterium oceani]|uniref:hypothetical protein n=1 Tax=Brevibacterium oceani TaxID=358099 RepID=UPI0015E7164E|nr:hypothetical protein [Brevibacterium oceani]
MTDQNALTGTSLLDVGLDAATAPAEAEDPWEAEERRLQEVLDARLRSQREAQAARSHREPQDAEAAQERQAGPEL